MKKIFLLSLTIVLASTINGCSKDEDNNTNPDSTPSLVGKWKTVKYDYYTNGVLTQTDITVENNASCPDFIEFKENGTYVEINNDANCNSTVDASGTYNYNGTSITSTSGGTTDITTVISLTSTDMKTDFTETSSNGTVFKNVGYFKKIN